MVVNAGKVPNAGLTLVQHCFSTIHYPNPLPRVASHRLGTTTLIQLWYNVGTNIPDFGTTHPLSWVGCEQNLETLELDVFNAVNVLQGTY